MKADANIVPLLRQIGSLTIRYQAFIKGFSTTNEVLFECVRLQEMVENEYSTLRSLLDDSFGGNAAVLNEDNASGSPDTHP